MLLGYLTEEENCYLNGQVLADWFHVYFTLELIDEGNEDLWTLIERADLYLETLVALE